MRDECIKLSDPRIQAAIAGLKELILERYPDAIFTVFRGSDPEGVYLRAEVDIEDADEVMDVVVDRLYELEVEQELPIYVIPVESSERAAAAIRARAGWARETVEGINLLLNGSKSPSTD